MRRQIAYIFGSSSSSIGLGIDVDVDVQQTHSRHILPHSNLFLYLYTIDVSVKVYYVVLIVRCVSLQEAGWWGSGRSTKDAAAAAAVPELLLSSGCQRQIAGNWLQIHFIHTHTYAHEDAFLCTPTHLYGLTNQRTHTHRGREAGIVIGL